MSQTHLGNTQPAIDNEEHEHSLNPATKRVLIYGYDGSAKQIVKTNTDGELIISSGGGEQAQRIDTATATVTYIGVAAIGSATASAVWKIKKLDTSSIALSVTWADSNDLYDNVWDNRASLTYG